MPTEKKMLKNSIILQKNNRLTDSCRQTSFMFLFQFNLALFFLLFPSKKAKKVDDDENLSEIMVGSICLKKIFSNPVWKNELPLYAWSMYVIDALNWLDFQHTTLGNRQSQLIRMRSMSKGVLQKSHSGVNVGLKHYLNWILI